MSSHPALAREGPAPDAPLIHQSGPLRTLWRFRQDKLRFLVDTAREGPLMRLWLGPQLIYMMRDPALIKHVLVDNNQNYDKATVGYDALRIFLGDGLLTSEGDFWRRQRRIAQPAFHRQRIAGFAEVMSTFTEQMLDQWENVALSGRPFDVTAETGKLTLRIAAKTLLGADPTDDADAVSDAVGVLNHSVNRLLMTWVPLPLWLPTPFNLRAKQAIRAIDGVVGAIITRRRESGEDPGDLLSMLMHAEDAETGERMTDKQLRDEAVTMFVAGHETTANALSWTFYLLSKHPGATRRIRDEVREVVGEGPVEARHVRALEYTERVVKESMRLFPPAWIIDRNTREDDEVAGMRIRKGGMIIVSPWATHRQPELWPNPMGFDPDRFLPEAEKRRPRYAYFPFGGGPRMCIGQPFAMLEAVLVTAAMVRRFDLALVPGHPVEPEPLVTLRPRHGLQMVPTRAAR